MQRKEKERVCVVKGWWSEGCLEQERSALLQLRHFFNDDKHLHYWVDDENYSDCCQCEGVECNNTNGRVIELDLRDTRNRESAEWHLNASLFTPLQQLEFLDLSWNNIVVYVENEGLERLSRLNNLNFLFLGHNYFNNSNFLSLGGLSSLRILSLAGNGLNGSIDIKGLDSLSNLEELDISTNAIDNLVVPKDLRGLRKLNTLRLGGSGIPMIDGSKMLVEVNTSFLQIVSELMASLRLLSLSYSRLNKNTILDQGFCQLVHLQELYIRDNDLRDSLLGAWQTTSLQELNVASNKLTRNFPLGLCELVLLRELYIDNNDLSGSLPLCLTNLTSLQVLDVSYNQLTESISSSPLMLLTSIEELILSNNHFQIPISLEPLSNLSKLKAFNGEIYLETESHYNSLTPKFQLTSISLSGYRDDGTFPKFLYHQHDLKNADLSHLNLSGEFPNWMPIHCLQKLATLDVSNNFFQGHIPVEIGTYLPGLMHLNLSRNAFNGSIPSSFADMKMLKSLDISYNQLTSAIPERMAMGCFTLEILALSNNSLQGHIFSKKFNLTNLKRLQLDGNKFIGEIPESLSKCYLLGGLYLSDNHLSGEIPAQLCQLKEVRLIDLSHNNLSGHIPFCLVNTALSEGEIPTQIGYLTRIRALNLSHNNLTGTIPITFSNLKQIESLDLSYNLLHGKIPQLIVLTTLAVFRVAYNNLSGKIPDRVAQFSTFEEDSYEGNPFLYGQPLSKSCDDNGLTTVTTEAYTENEEGGSLIDMDSFLITFTVSYGIAIIGIIGVLYVNPYWRRRWFYLVEVCMTSCYYFVGDNLILKRFYRGRV
ncbi:Receptor-like protein 13 [Citrus sinensis]|nr:Receptor-like protein 13 [Citrus sinensis]